MKPDPSLLVDVVATRVLDAWRAASEALRRAGVRTLNRLAPHAKTIVEMAGAESAVPLTDLLALAHKSAFIEPAGAKKIAQALAMIDAPVVDEFFRRHVGSRLVGAVAAARIAKGGTGASPAIPLSIANITTEVNVRPASVIAAEQIKVEEHQRLLGAFPNFYVSYIPDAAPLTTKLKYRLAWKSSTDLITVGGVAFLAGLQQPRARLIVALAALLRLRRRFLLLILQVR